MMTCKEVSTLMSTGGLDGARWRVRLAVRLHLSMCRHCRAFKRQLEALARAARTLSTSLETELPKDFEATLSERLSRTSSS
jgi:predicted anti-sigma-YlaC factor YlaD